MHTIVRQAMALLATVAVIATTLGAPVMAAEHAPGEKLPELPLAFGTESGVGWYSDGEGVGWRDPGTWSVTRARTGPDGRLSFHVSVTPPVQGVPLDAGPAFLSAALWYQGGLGGDVGFGRVVQMLNVDAGTCTGSPCTYEADVVLDATAIRRAIEALPRVDPGWVDVGLRLVRTYGQGQWLQVLDLVVREEPGNRPLRNGGTLRQPTDASGGIVSDGITRASDAQASRGGLRPAFDLVSIIEASRARQGDASAATPSVVVELDIDARSCRWWNTVWIIDEWGTNGFAGAVGEIDPRGEPVRLPDGGTWRVTMGNPFPDEDDDGSATAGTFDTAGSDLRVEATFECTGSHAATASAFEVDVAEGIAEPSSAGGWSTVRRAFSARTRGPRPFVLASLDGTLLSLESGPEGWRLRRSQDGWRWQRQPFSVRGRSLPEPGSAELARLAATDGGLVLATIVAGADGRPRLASWTSPNGRRWRASPSTTRLPGAVDDLQLAAATDLVLALATGPRRARLLSSDEGRSWRAAGPASVVAIGRGHERILGILDEAGRAVVSETADGATWMPVWDAPAAATGPYLVGETDAGVLLVAGNDGATTSAWLREPDGSAWIEVLRTALPTRVDELAVYGDDVVLSGEVRNEGDRSSRAPWLASSLDGGRRWRQSLDDDTSGRCRLRAAAGDGALVVATADCDDQPTLWRAEPGR